MMKLNIRILKKHIKKKSKISNSKNYLEAEPEILIK